MTKVRQIYDFINEKAPFSEAMGFDNVGLLVGSYSSDVTKILITLDVTKDVVFEAQKLGANLIVSHHPVIFDPLKSVETDSVVSLLIKNDISVISAHTNLDIADGGVNDCLAKKAELCDVKKMYLDGYALGRVGTLKKEMSVEEFVSFIKEKLGSNTVRYVKGNKPCKKIALVCGSGGDAVFEAISNGADTLLTGEAKYNHFHDAYEKGINLVEAGHFATEWHVVYALYSWLSEKFDTECIISKTNIQLPIV